MEGFCNTDGFSLGCKIGEHLCNFWKSLEIVAFQHEVLEAQSYQN